MTNNATYQRLFRISFKSLNKGLNLLQICFATILYNIHCKDIIQAYYNISCFMHYSVYIIFRILITRNLPLFSIKRYNCHPKFCLCFFQCFCQDIKRHIQYFKGMVWRMYRNANLVPSRLKRLKVYFFGRLTCRGFNI